MEWAFHAVYPLLSALPGVAAAYEKEKFFPWSGKNCDIDCPEKWKVFSTLPRRLVPYTGLFMGNPLGLSRSTFGIPIAKEGISD
jgi:hypothetical protein